MSTTTEHWAVTVDRNGESILTLSSEHLSGRDLSAADEHIIRYAAEHLLAFIGKADMPVWTAEAFEFQKAWDALRWTLVTFSERKQEFFCTVCRYRDPLGPDGNKLHDDQCPWLLAQNALDALIPTPELPVPPASGDTP